MIILHRLRAVYLGLPKTGSTTIHRWLAQPQLLGHGDVDARHWGGQHDVTPPPEATDYFTFASIRDEFERQRSLWRHYLSEVDRNERPGPKPAYWQFRQWQLSGMAPPFFVLGPEHLAQTRIDQFVRLEHLESDLRRLPFANVLWRRLQPPGHANRNQLNPPETFPWDSGSV